MFVGFPGFVSKLWLAADERGSYRGLYEWDGTQDAETYARALWRVLALVSVKGSIAYHLLPELKRDELVADPGGHVQRDLPARTTTQGKWWRLIQADRH